jgi:hypothetical protein
MYGLQVQVVYRRDGKTYNICDREAWKQGKKWRVRQVGMERYRRAWDADGTLVLEKVDCSSQSAVASTRSLARTGWLRG